MSEAVFNRLVAIIENGTYGGASLGAKGLRSFPDSLDAIRKPAVLILPRSDTGWVKDSGSGRFITTLSYDLRFYIKEAKTGADETGLADTVNINELAAKLFLSRLQLQASGLEDIAEIVEEITWQTTSNLATPIAYPPENVSSGQGARLYWGFIARLTVPYRQHIDFSLRG
jgi:hypothetical protein